MASGGRHEPGRCCMARRYDTAAIPRPPPTSPATPAGNTNDEPPMSSLDTSQSSESSGSTGSTGYTETTTRNVRVGVTTFYVPERSRPHESLSVYGYRIVILNEGEVRVKLLSRHWIILDAEGNREEVRGPGVVGQTPTLDPGRGFKYVSWCPLRTPWGTMEGTYQMRDENRKRFDVEIGRFILSPRHSPVAARDV